MHYKSQAVTSWVEVATNQLFSCLRCVIWEPWRHLLQNNSLWFVLRISEASDNLLPLSPIRSYFWISCCHEKSPHGCASRIFWRQDVLLFIWGELTKGHVWIIFSHNQDHEFPESSCLPLHVFLSTHQHPSPNDNGNLPFPAWNLLGSSNNTFITSKTYQDKWTNQTA